MSSRFLRRLGAVATVAIVGALLTPATASAIATAPEVTVQPCVGSTENGIGAATSFTFPENSTAAIAYWAGEAVPLYYNQGSIDGDVIIRADGSLDGTYGGVPLCMVVKTDNGPESAWRFCTDKQKSSCPSKPAQELPAPSEGQAKNPRLTLDQEKLITYLIGHSSNINADWNQDSTRGRALIQVQVWCISDGVSAATAASYFNTQLGNNWASGVSCADTTNWELEDATVDDPSSASLEVTLVGKVGTGEILTGDIVKFTVLQSYTAHVSLSADNGGQIVECTEPHVPADVNPLVTKAVPFEVCVEGTQAAVVTLSAISRFSTPDDITWFRADQENSLGNDSNGCQAYADFAAGDSDNRSGSDTATFEEPVTSTTEPPTTTTPPVTTTNPPNPPATTQPPATTTETTELSGTSGVDATEPTTSIAVEGESSTTASTTVEVQGEQDSEDLASTGVSTSTWMLAIGGALLIGMGALLARTRRTSRAH